MDSGPLNIDYTNFYYDQAELLRPLVGILYLGFVCLLIYLLGHTSNSYFSPALATICEKLKLPYNVAGVTLLAFGNGAPDVFSSITSFRGDNEILIGIGALLGGSVFISTVIVGVITIITPYNVVPQVFVRDVSFFLLSITILSSAVMVGDVTFIIPISMLLVYIMYVIVVMRSWRSDVLFQQDQPQDSLQKTLLGETDEENEHMNPISINNNENEQNNRWNSPSIPIHSTGDSQEEYIDLKSISSSSQSYDYNSTQANTSLTASLSSTIGEQKRVEYEFLTINEELDNTLSGTSPSDTLLDANRAEEGERIYSASENNTTVNNTAVTIKVLEEYSSQESKTVSEASDHLNATVQRSSSDEEYGQRKRLSDHQINKEKRTSIKRNSMTGKRFLSPFKFLYIDKSPNERAVNEVVEGFSPFSPSLLPTITVDSTSRKIRQRDRYFWREWYLHKKLKRRFLMSDWDSYSCFTKLIVVLEAPLILIRDLTIPTIDPEQWNKYFAVSYPILCPCLCLWVLGLHRVTIGEIPIVIISLLCCGVLSCYIYLKTHFNKPPEHGIFTLLLVMIAFIMCIVWIFIFASELVTCLNSIGIISGIPPSILGLTILAWGNCTGDFFADISLSKRGFVEMAMSGCYAGPIFNLMIGLGISLLIACSNSYPEPFDLQLDLSSIIAIVFLYFGLLSSLLIVYLCSFRMEKGFGYYLLCFYGFYILVQVAIYFLS